MRTSARADVPPAPDCGILMDMEHQEFFKLIKKKAVHGPYYLKGPEEYVKERAVRQASDIPGEAARDLNVLLFKAPNLDPVAIIGACESLPFFDDHKVVIVRDFTNDIALPLAEYLGRVPDTTLLLFVRKDEPKSGDLIYEWFKEHPDRIVDFKHLDPAGLSAFLTKRANENGIAIGNAEKRFLVEYVGADMAALENALLQAGAYVGQGNPVTKQAIEKCVTPNREYQFFVIGDLLFSGKVREGILMLENETRSGRQQRFPFLFYLNKRIRDLIVVSQMRSLGKTRPEIRKASGISSDFMLDKTIALTKKYSMKRLLSMQQTLSGLIAGVLQNSLSDRDSLFLSIYKLFTEAKS